MNERSDRFLLERTTSPRARDRRHGLHDVVTTIGRVLSQRGDPATIRGTFEEAVRQALTLRAVRVVDGSSRRWRVSEGTAESVIAFDVPGWSLRTTGVLEVVFGAAGPPGEWEMQQLHAVAHLAALVLELERPRTATAKGDQPGSAAAKRDGAAPLIGSTPVMAALRTRIERVAVTDFTVLLEGESGVGKELVARQIHELSPRRNGPFVAINCAALVETLLEAELFGIEERTATGVRGRRGKFEHAEGGTLFLDEVSDLSLSAQAKLLRAIQDLSVERVGATGTRRVDIRIVAATNRGLADMVERKLFRADLFYRLGGVDVRVPPLRERRSDIRELAHYFLERHRQTRRLQLSEPAALALMDHQWPGNVRELERLIERAIALAANDTIELDDLPAAVRGHYDAVLMPSYRQSESLRYWASRYARLMYHRCEGNKRRTARVLGISCHTLDAHLHRIDEVTLEGMSDEGDGESEEVGRGRALAER